MATNAPWLRKIHGLNPRGNGAGSGPSSPFAARFRSPCVSNCRRPVGSQAARVHSGKAIVVFIVVVVGVVQIVDSGRQF